MNLNVNNFMFMHIDFKDCKKQCVNKFMKYYQKKNK